MKQFEVGKTYTMRSVCNQDACWTYTVTARTACTVTLTDGKETKRCRISKQTSQHRDAESVYPLGQYSMAPILSADAELLPDPEKVEEAQPVTGYTVSGKLVDLVVMGALSGRINRRLSDFLVAVANGANLIVEQ